MNELSSVSKILHSLFGISQSKLQLWKFSLFSQIKLPQIEEWIKNINSKPTDKTLHLKQGIIYNVSYLEYIQTNILKDIIKDSEKDKLLKHYKSSKTNLFLPLLKDILLVCVYEDFTKNT